MCVEGETREATRRGESHCIKFEHWGFNYVHSWKGRGGKWLVEASPKAFAARDIRAIILKDCDDEYAMGCLISFASFNARKIKQFI